MQQTFVRPCRVNLPWVRSGQSPRTPVWPGSATCMLVHLFLLRSRPMGRRWPGTPHLWLYTLLSISLGGGEPGLGGGDQALAVVPHPSHVPDSCVNSPRERNPPPGWVAVGPSDFSSLSCPTVRGQLVLFPLSSHFIAYSVSLYHLHCCHVV